MGTRSTIAIERADGTVVSVYCHWDGDIGYNGAILQRHYSDAARLQQLIDHGNISSLGREIGQQHPFGPAYHEKDPVKRAELNAEYDHARENGWCTFYARDRGEDLSNSFYRDFDTYVKNNNHCEYNYILRQSGEWFVSLDRQPAVFKSLTVALDALTA